MSICKDYDAEKDFETCGTCGPEGGACELFNDCSAAHRSMRECEAHAEKRLNIERRLEALEARVNAVEGRQENFEPRLDALDNKPLWVAMEKPELKRREREAYERGRVEGLNGEHGLSEDHPAVYVTTASGEDFVLMLRSERARQIAAAREEGRAEGERIGEARSALGDFAKLVSEKNHAVVCHDGERYHIHTQQELDDIKDAERECGEAEGREAEKADVLRLAGKIANDTYINPLGAFVAEAKANIHRTKGES